MSSTKEEEEVPVLHEEQTPISPEEEKKDPPDVVDSTQPAQPTAVPTDHAVDKEDESKEKNGMETGDLVGVSSAEKEEEESKEEEEPIPKAMDDEDKEDEEREEDVENRKDEADVPNEEEKHVVKEERTEEVPKYVDPQTCIQILFSEQLSFV
jgi:hypothetical protein